MFGCDTSDHRDKQSGIINIDTQIQEGFHERELIIDQQFAKLGNSRISIPRIQTGEFSIKRSPNTKKMIQQKEP